MQRGAPRVPRLPLLSVTAGRGHAGQTGVGSYYFRSGVLARRGAALRPSRAAARRDRRRSHPSSSARHSVAQLARPSSTYQRLPVRRRREHECDRASSNSGAPQDGQRGVPGADAADGYLTPIPAMSRPWPPCTASGNAVDGAHTIAIVSMYKPAPAVRQPLLVLAGVRRLG